MMGVMSDLTRHGSPVDSVFHLLGRDENDLTAALGFTLARSPTFMSAFLRHLLPDTSGTTAALGLEVRGQIGRTDLEISSPDAMLAIEAKRDWLLPTASQLSRYAPRILERGGGALVSLSQASRSLAASQLPTHIDGVPVIHLPWQEVVTVTEIYTQGCPWPRTCLAR